MWFYYWRDAVATVTGRRNGIRRYVKYHAEKCQEWVSSINIKENVLIKAARAINRSTLLASCEPEVKEVPCYRAYDDKYEHLCRVPS